jgi:carbon monoxide dehydrogenase subunit G
MTKIVKEFDVGASPERVYSVVSNPEGWSQWASFVRAASSKGSKTHWEYEMGRMKVASDTEETERQEGRVYGFRQTTGFLKSGGSRFEIHPSTKGSLVTWSNEYELPYSYLGTLIDKLKARKQFEKGMDESIENLKKVLER